MLKKFELILKQLEYPFSEDLIIASDARLNFIEHLLRVHSETLFQYFQIDHSDLKSRIKSIKCQLWVTGMWGQSKHGKNLDLNKLIQGICSYDQSLLFVYKLSKHVADTKELDPDVAILKDCLRMPYDLINPNANPFDLTVPRDEEYPDVEDLQGEIDDILELQAQDLAKLEGSSKERIRIGQISEDQLRRYEEQLKKANSQLQDLDQHKEVLRTIEVQNNLEDKYSLRFPEDYTEAMERYKAITIIKPMEMNSFDESKVQELKNDELYFI